MSNTFKLPPELTIYTVSAARQDLQAWLAQPPGDDSAKRSLDARDVVDCDSAGLQLLGALANSLAAQGEQLELQHASGKLLEICRRLGCMAWFVFDTPAEAS